jgi:uncharacterized protein (DUF302 family)
MDTNLTYGFKKTLYMSLDEADARVRDALKKEGFGVLTEIDVKSTLEQKLGVDFRPYRILGACNPSLAHRALTAEPDIGLLLPCNVVVYAGERDGTSVVAILDPAKQLAVSGRRDLEPLAAEVREKMKRVLDAL